MKKQLTDPYGSLEFAVGSGDDFVCFDYYHDKARKRVLLHAVLNSETGSFIEDFQKPEWISYRQDVLAPYRAAENLVNMALDWCADNTVEHDTEGWNQDPMYFARAVHASFTKTGPAIRKAVEMVRRPINTGNYL